MDGIDEEMKIHLILVVILALTILCFVTVGQRQVNADNLPDDSDQLPFYNNYYKSRKSIIDDIDPRDYGYVYDNNNHNDNHKKDSSNNNNHHDSSNNNHKKSNDNHKESNDNNCCYDSSKKFHIDIILDNQYNSNDKKYEVRVVVYGIHTLNKPTLDNPGKTVYISNLEYTNVGTWSFSDWKVHSGDEIKACAINVRNNVESCGYGTLN